ncbi:hypothetical protein HDU96_000343 [Phlyctochytrium bullatum]|nr:hypothetical protein HDU96_000343 [Phlyctochytrium bullatum]
MGNDGAGLGLTVELRPTPHVHTTEATFTFSAAEISDRLARFRSTTSTPPTDLTGYHLPSPATPPPPLHMLSITPAHDAAAAPSLPAILLASRSTAAAATPTTTLRHQPRGPGPFPGRIAWHPLRHVQALSRSKPPQVRAHIDMLPRVDLVDPSCTHPAPVAIHEPSAQGCVIYVFRPGGAGVHLVSFYFCRFSHGDNVRADNAVIAATLLADNGFGRVVRGRVRGRTHAVAGCRCARGGVCEAAELAFLESLVATGVMGDEDEDPVVAAAGGGLKPLRVVRRHRGKPDKVLMMLRPPLERLLEVQKGVFRLWNIVKKQLHEFPLPSGSLDDACGIPPYACISYCHHPSGTLAPQPLTDVIPNADPAWTFATVPVKTLKRWAKVLKAQNVQWVWIDAVCMRPGCEGEVFGDPACMRDVWKGCEEAYVFLEIAREVDEVVGERWFRRVWTLQEALLPPGVKAVLCDPSNTIHDLETLLALVLQRAEDADRAVSAATLRAHTSQITVDSCDLLRQPGTQRSRRSSCTPTIDNGSSGSSDAVAGRRAVAPKALSGSAGSGNLLAPRSRQSSAGSFRSLQIPAVVSPACSAGGSHVDDMPAAHARKFSVPGFLSADPEQPSAPGPGTTESKAASLSALPALPRKLSQKTRHHLAHLAHLLHLLRSPPPDRRFTFPQLCALTHARGCTYPEDRVFGVLGLLGDVAVPRGPAPGMGLQAALEVLVERVGPARLGEMVAATVGGEDEAGVGLLPDERRRMLPLRRLSAPVDVWRWAWGVSLVAPLARLWVGGDPPAEEAGVDDSPVVGGRVIEEYAGWPDPLDIVCGAARELLGPDLGGAARWGLRHVVLKDEAGGLVVALVAGLEGEVGMTGEGSRRGLKLVKLESGEGGVVCIVVEGFRKVGVAIVSADAVEWSDPEPVFLVGDMDVRWCGLTEAMLKKLTKGWVPPEALLAFSAAVAEKLVEQGKSLQEETPSSKPGTHELETFSGSGNTLVPYMAGETGSTAVSIMGDMVAPIATPNPPPTPSLWTILTFQFRLLLVAASATFHVAVLGWGAQVLSTVLCRAGPAGGLPYSFDPAIVSYGIAWTFIVIDGDSPSSRLGKAKISVFTQQAKVALKERSRKMFQERGLFRFKFNRDVRLGPMLLQCLSASIATFILNAMVAGAIHLTLSSLAGMVLVNMLLPVGQALVLYMCWPMENTDALWAAKHFAYATVQFPLKFVLFITPFSWTEGKPMLWLSLVGQVLLERLFPRAIDFIVQRAAERAAQTSVAPLELTSPDPSTTVPAEGDLPLYESTTPAPVAPSTVTKPRKDPLAHLTRRLLSLVAYTSSRNDLTLSNYVSTLSGLVCALGPNPFSSPGSREPGWSLASSATFGMVPEGDERMALTGWRERIALGMMMVGLQMVSEAVIVAFEARAGVPVESDIPTNWAVYFNFGLKHIQNCLAAYSAVHGIFS